mgnify:CR=1 FL=1
MGPILWLMTGIILFLGSNPSILALAEYHISRAGYQAEGFLEEDAVIQRLNAGGVMLLILGPGVEDGARVHMRTYCHEHAIKLLEHYGGPGALLESVETVLN